jgi:phospholipid-translocating ATPase
MNASSSTPQFPSNKVSNTKYTPITFIPRFLMEQFSASMNLYFLMIAFLQLWRAITPVNPITTWAPLILVTCISAVKEVFEDLKRHHADTLANQRNFILYEDGGAGMPRKSEEIRPGDVVELSDGEEAPCDLLLLRVESIATSGLAYVETANLDGETDLKPRQAKRELQSQTLEQLLLLRGALHCEPPNADLYRFDAQLKLRTHGVQIDGMGADPGLAISGHQLIQHGTVLRKTGKIIAMAAYTGSETKMNQNRLPPPTKVAAVDKYINRIVVAVFLFQLCLVVVFAILGYVYSGTGDSKMWYMEWPGSSAFSHGDHQDIVNHLDVDDPEWDNNVDFNHSISFRSIRLRGHEQVRRVADSNYVVQPWYTSLILPLRFLLLSSMVVPISLKVTLDFIKVLYARWIIADMAMYDPARNMHASATNSAVVEDLGQISTVLTDKTGTLTENIMTWSSICIGGMEYTSDALPGSPPDIQRALINADTQATEFMRILALCNTVLPEHVDAILSASDTELALDGSRVRRRCIQYLSASPDEEALVHAAACSGISLAYRHCDHDGTAKVTLAVDPASVSIQRDVPAVERLPLAPEDRLAKRIWIHDRQIERTYVVLHVLEFTSARKCMSVLLRRVDIGRARDIPDSDPFAPPNESQLFGAGFAGVDSDELILLTKGADDIVRTRLSACEASSASADARVAVEEHLRQCSRKGLRTLMIAAKTVSPEDYARWLPVWEQAHRELHDRAEKIELACTALETNLVLLGSTAIEDQLQAGVPDTLQSLRAAGIKIWMLTGDKADTAMQIARAAKMFSDPPSDASSGGATVLHVRGNTDESVNHELHQMMLAYRGVRTPTHQDTDLEAQALLDDSRTAPVQIERVLVVDGIPAIRHSISQANIALFQQIASGCSVVICCRCLPSQKAALVTVAKSAGQLCLAIGDGGNDVAMIQAADVGVGISGREGKQATRAADFSISQFRYLQRLLLVHGRLSHFRTSLIAQYTFYKSMCVCFVQLGFNFACAFSGCSLLDTFALTTYNMLYTFLPGLAMVLDKDRHIDDVSRNPEYYAECRKSKWFTKKTFFMWWLRAILQSITILFVCTCAAKASGASGDSADQTSLAYTVYSTLILVQFVTVLSEMRNVTLVNITVTAGCLLSYLFFVSVRDIMPSDSTSLGTFAALRKNSSSAATTLLLVTVCTLPAIAPKAALFALMGCDRFSVQPHRADTSAVQADEIMELPHLPMPSPLRAAKDARYDR